VLQRTEYPAGVPCFIDSGRKDPDVAMAFYGGLLGWEFEDVTPPGGEMSYFMASLNGMVVAGLGGQPEMDWPPAWNTYVCVEDADAAAAAVHEAGGTVTMGPFRVGPAGRMVVFNDLEGAELCLWEPGQTRGSQLVNDPGAWVFSTLHTADASGAGSFYGSLFEWTLASAGDDGSAMVMKPGYQEFLAQADPELPGRLEAFGAPEGFGDVVASILPLADGERPHWDVTFSVEDADSTASRAAELGGEVVVAPFDAPWVRATVLRDPDGVVFHASQFVPPGSG
jgi:predicted enzyme related to lactoylglutathione lyase